MTRVVVYSAPWVSHRQSVSHTHAPSAPWVSHRQSVSYTRAPSAPWVSHRQAVSHTHAYSAPWVSHRQAVSHTHATCIARHHGKKESCLRDSPPAAGRFCDIFHNRRSAIPAELF